MFDTSLSAYPVNRPTLITQSAGHGERRINMTSCPACRNQGAMFITMHGLGHHRPLHDTA